MDTAADGILYMSAERSNTITNIFKEAGKRLLGFIRTRVDSIEEAEDIFQDVFYQFAATTQPIETATAWLYTVARNKITDSYRKQKLPLAEDIFENSDEEEGLGWKEILLPATATPETEYIRNVFWTELKTALDELPAEQRLVFIKNELEGVPFKELSEQTGETVATLISRKRYAVLHLRKRLEVLREEMLTK